MILHGELESGKLVKISARSTTEWVKEEETTSEADKANNDNGVITIKAEDEKSAKPYKANQAVAKTLTTIEEDFNNVLAFLQAVAIKSPQVIAAPLSLRADKRVRVWFQRWIDINLLTLAKPAPQDHLGLTGVRTDVATQLHTAEALHPIVAAQREAEKETKGWGRLPPTTQRVILEASATTRTSIPNAPPLTIHGFLNLRNGKALQADCSLTYAGTTIIYPPPYVRSSSNSTYWSSQTQTRQQNFRLF